MQSLGRCLFPHASDVRPVLFALYTRHPACGARNPRANAPIQGFVTVLVQVGVEGVTSYWPTASVQPRCLVYVELCPLMARARSCIRRWLTGVHLVYKALVVSDGVVSRRVGVYCMYWTTARHKPLSLALLIYTLTDGPEWLIDALTCHSSAICHNLTPSEPSETFAAQQERSSRVRAASLTVRRIARNVLDRTTFRQSGHGLTILRGASSPILPFRYRS